MMALAQCHNHSTGQCNPSAAYIADRTEHDVKTVRRCLDSLEFKGLIAIKRKPGRSPDYLLNLTQNWVYPLLGTPEKGEATIPENGQTPYPKLGNETGKKKETETGIKKDSKKKRSSRCSVDNFDFSTWPREPDPETWLEYVELRNKKRATTTQTVVNMLGKEIEKLEARGFTVDDVLAYAIYRGWQGLKAEWIQDDPFAEFVSGFRGSGNQTTRGRSIAENLADRSWAN